MYTRTLPNVYISSVLSLFINFRFGKPTFKHFKEICLALIIHPIWYYTSQSWSKIDLNEDQLVSRFLYHHSIKIVRGSYKNKTYIYSFVYAENFTFALNKLSSYKIHYNSNSFLSFNFNIRERFVFQVIYVK